MFCTLLLLLLPSTLCHVMDEVFAQHMMILSRWSSDSAEDVLFI